MQKLNIRRDEGIVDIQIINKIEEIVGFKFPTEYKILISSNNALRPRNGTFKYYDKVVKREEQNGIYFYAFANENLDPLYCDGIVGDFSYIDDDYFPKQVIPFGGTGNGDYICFDYRDNPQTDNPQIVLVHHDADDDNGTLMISFLANSFEEFIDMLYDYKD